MTTPDESIALEDPAPRPGWAARLFGATDTDRLDRYTRLSTTVVLPVMPALAWADLARLDGTGPRWVALGLGGLIGVTTLLSMILLGPALDVQLHRRTASKRLWVPLVAGILASLLGSCLLLPLEMIGLERWQAPHVTAAYACAAPAAVLGCMTSTRRILQAWAAVCASALALVLLRGQEASPAIALAVSSGLITGALVLTGRLSGWMLGVLAELEQARATSARLAVAEERLRFSRDLHDVVGRGLSAIALKSQLAAELTRRGRTEQGVEEMVAVHGLAQDALAEMRQVVAGYRRADLATELAQARGVLDAAGIALVVRGEAALLSLPEDEQEALAWAVRESVTNVVRHSDARHCSIVFENTAAPRLTITNDGVARQPVGPPGVGLLGLGERLAGLNGRLDHSRQGRAFVVQVTLPQSPTPARVSHG